MARVARYLVLMGSMLPIAVAQQPSANSATASCSFQDGKQLAVRYDGEHNEVKKQLPAGKLWMPGGQPMWLFAPAELSVGDAKIPVGAYSMYIIPGKENWTLVVNRNVKPGTDYKQQEDLARVTMPTGQLSNPQPFNVVFGHVAPKQCNLRIYYGKTGSWAEFHEK